MTRDDELRLRGLDERIKEIAVKLCGDYPNIQGCGSFERLWALESSLEGTNQAIEHWVLLVEKLKSKFGISSEIILQISKEVMEETTPNIASK